MAVAPAKKFERRAEERPNHLAQAAFDLFIANGYERTKVADIARRAGVTAGTVYRYFPSKRHLLEHLIVERLKPQALAPHGDHGRVEVISPADRLKAVFLGVAERLSDPETRLLPLLILREAALVPELAAAYRTHAIGSLVPLIREAVVAGVADGSFRKLDPQIVAAGLFGGLMSHIILAEFSDIEQVKSRSEQGDFMQVAKDHFDLILNGLEART